MPHITFRNVAITRPGWTGLDLSSPLTALAVDASRLLAPNAPSLQDTGISVSLSALRHALTNPVIIRALCRAVAPERQRFAAASRLEVTIARQAIHDAFGPEGSSALRSAMGGSLGADEALVRDILIGITLVAFSSANLLTAWSPLREYSHRDTLFPSDQELLRDWSRVALEDWNVPTLARTSAAPMTLEQMGFEAHFRTLALEYYKHMRQVAIRARGIRRGMRTTAHWFHSPVVEELSIARDVVEDVMSVANLAAATFRDIGALGARGPRVFSDADALVERENQSVVLADLRDFISSLGSAGSPYEMVSPATAAGMLTISHHRDRFGRTALTLLYPNVEAVQPAHIVIRDNPAIAGSANGGLALEARPEGSRVAGAVRDLTPDYPLHEAADYLAESGVTAQLATALSEFDLTMYALIASDMVSYHSELSVATEDEDGNPLPVVDRLAMADGEPISAELVRGYGTIEYMVKPRPLTELDVINRIVAAVDVGTVTTTDPVVAIGLMPARVGSALRYFEPPDLATERVLYRTPEGHAQFRVGSPFTRHVVDPVQLPAVTDEHGVEHPARVANGTISFYSALDLPLVGEESVRISAAHWFGVEMAADLWAMLYNAAYLSEDALTDEGMVTLTSGTRESTVLGMADRAVWSFYSTLDGSSSRGVTFAPGELAASQMTLRALYRDTSIRRHRAVIGSAVMKAIVNRWSLSNGVTQTIGVGRTRSAVGRYAAVSKNILGTMMEMMFAPGVVKDTLERDMANEEIEAAVVRALHQEG